MGDEITDVVDDGEDDARPVVTILDSTTGRGNSLTDCASELVVEFAVEDPDDANSIVVIEVFETDCPPDDIENCMPVAGALLDSRSLGAINNNPKVATKFDLSLLNVISSPASTGCSLLPTASFQEERVVLVRVRATDVEDFGLVSQDERVVVLGDALPFVERLVIADVDCPVDNENAFFVDEPTTIELTIAEIQSLRVGEKARVDLTFEFDFPNDMPDAGLVQGRVPGFPTIVDLERTAPMSRKYTADLEIAFDPESIFGSIETRFLDPDAPRFLLSVTSGNGSDDVAPCLPYEIEFNDPMSAGPFILIDVDDEAAVSINALKNDSDFVPENRRSPMTFELNPRDTDLDDPTVVVDLGYRIDDGAVMRFDAGTLQVPAGATIQLDSTMTSILTVELPNSVITNMPSSLSWDFANDMTAQALGEELEDFAVFAFAVEEDEDGLGENLWIGVVGNRLADVTAAGTLLDPLVRQSQTLALGYDVFERVDRVQLDLRFADAGVDTSGPLSTLVQRVVVDGPESFNEPIRLGFDTQKLIGSTERLIDVDLSWLDVLSAPNFPIAGDSSLDETPPLTVAAPGLYVDNLPIRGNLIFKGANNFVNPLFIQIGLLDDVPDTFVQRERAAWTLHAQPEGLPEQLLAADFSEIPAGDAALFLEELLPVPESGRQSVFIILDVVDTNLGSAQPEVRIEQRLGNTRPELTAISIEPPSPEGNVPLAFTVSEAVRDVEPVLERATVSIDYLILPDGEFQPATISGDLLGDWTQDSPKDFAVVWNSAVDIPGEDVEAIVRVRVREDHVFEETGLASDADVLMESTAIPISNNEAPVVNPPEGIGFAPNDAILPPEVMFTVTGMDDDALDLELRYGFDAGGPFDLRATAPIAIADPSTGFSEMLTWNFANAPDPLASDQGDQTVFVQARVTESDDPDVEARSTAVGPFLVRFNAPPEIAFDPEPSALPDGRRGIPVPFTIMDDDDDDTLAVVQWAEDSEEFEDLPQDKGQMEAALADPDERERLGVAREAPSSVEGRIVRASANSAALAGISGVGSRLTPFDEAGLVGRELEVLRDDVRIFSDLPNPDGRFLHAAQSIGDGREAYALAGTFGGSSTAWEVHRLDLATGASLELVGEGDGRPVDLDWEPGRRSLIVLAQTSPGDRAALFRVFVDGTQPSVVPLLDEDISIVEESNAPTGLAALGDGSAVVISQQQLRVAHYTAGETPRIPIVVEGLRQGLDVLRDLTRPEVVYFSESFEARVSALDLTTLRIRTVVTGLPRASALAFERGGARLLVLVDESKGEGGPRRLLGVELRGREGDAPFEASEPFDELTFEFNPKLCTGLDNLRLVTMEGGSFLAGGLEQVRSITGHSPETFRVQVAADFDPPVEEARRWRIRDRVRAGGPMVADTWVWDTLQARTSSNVKHRLTVYDGTAKVDVTTKEPAPVDQPLNTPSVDQALPLSIDAAQLFADVNGDGESEVLFDQSDVSTGNDVILRELRPGGAELSFEDVLGDPLQFYTDIDDLALADVGGNELLDVLVAGNELGQPSLEVAILRTATSQLGVQVDFSQTLATSTPLAGGGAVPLTEPSSIEVADLDGANAAGSRPEVIWVSREAGELWLLSLVVDISTFSSTHASLVPTSSHVNPVAATTADFDGDGRLDIAVAFEGNGDGNDGDVGIFLAEGGPLSFGLPNGGAVDPHWVLTSPTMIAPSDLVSGDFDRDGAMDVAVVHAGASNNVEVFFGPFANTGATVADADADLGRSQPGTPFELRAADADRDGWLDLAVRTTDAVVVLTNEEGAAFALSARAGGSTRPGLGFEDLDGTGSADLASATASNRELRFAVGAGVYADAERISLTGLELDAIAITDLDGDGRTDVAGASGQATNGLVSIRQEFPGQFEAAPRNILDGESPRHLVAGDLAGGDRRVDLLGSAGSTSTIYAQDASGVFSIVDTLDAPGDFLIANAVVDHLGDDDFADVAIAHEGGVRLFNRTGIPFASSGVDLDFDRFGKEPDIFRSALWVDSGDFDGDGDVDLAVLVSNDSVVVEILLQVPAGFQAAPPIGFPNGRTPTRITAGELDGDGRCDIAAVDNEGFLLTLLAEDPESGLWSAREVGGFSTPQDVAIGDLDGDGWPDLAVGGRESIGIYLQRGDGRFGRLEGQGQTATRMPDRILTTSVNSICTSVRIADLDADGDLDVAASLFGPAADAFLEIFYASH